MVGDVIQSQITLFGNLLLLFSKLLPITSYGCVREKKKKKEEMVVLVAVVVVVVTLSILEEALLCDENKRKRQRVHVNMI